MRDLKKLLAVQLMNAAGKEWQAHPNLRQSRAQSMFVRRAEAQLKLLHEWIGRNRGQLPGVPFEDWEEFQDIIKYEMRVVI